MTKEQLTRDQIDLIRGFRNAQWKSVLRHALQLSNAGDKRPDARALVKAFTDTFPHSSKGWMALAKVYNKTPEFRGEAKKCVQLAVRLSSSLPRDQQARTLMSAANFYARRHDNAHATQMFDKALEIDPNDPHTLHAAALFFLRDGDMPARGIGLLRKGLEVAPEDRHLKTLMQDVMEKARRSASTAPAPSRDSGPH